MRLRDIALHAQKTLPLYVDGFSKVVSVVDITAEDNLLTIETAEPHNLTEGEMLVLNGAYVPTKILSLTNDNGLGRLITDGYHNVTQNTPLREGDSTHITIVNANEEDYNGEFLIMDIPYGNVIEFSVDKNAPSVATGDNILLDEKCPSELNGLHHAQTILSDLKFTCLLPTPVENPVSFDDFTGNITMSGQVMIGSAFSLQHAGSLYTEKDTGEFVGYVVIDGADVSKSKVNGTDAIASARAGTDLRLEAIQTLNFYVFIPTKSEYAWDDYIDLCNNELRMAVLKTFHGLRITSGLYDTDNHLAYVGDTPVDTEGTATMVYNYKFQTTIFISNEDGVKSDYSRALRSFSIDGSNTFGEDESMPHLTAEGDLPDENIIVED